MGGPSGTSSGGMTWVGARRCLSCIFCLSTFASRRLFAFRAHFAVVLLRDRGLAAAAGSWRVGVGADVTPGIVSTTIGARKGSDCDGYDGAQLRGQGLPEGKCRMSARGVCGGASRPLTVGCGDLPAAGAVPGISVKVILCVTRVARDGSHLEGLSQGSGRDVLLLLSLIATFGRIWAGLPFISGANHFESADFPR